MSGQAFTVCWLFAGVAMASLALGGCEHDGSDAPRALSAMSCVAGADEIERLGCANAANLESMVASPADLEAPAALGRARGDAAFDAARRHREDRVDSLAGDAGYSSVEAAPEAGPQ